MRPSIALACCLLATACGNGASKPPPTRDVVAERAAAWSATSPPPARSCRGDEDCGVFGAIPGNDPCCDVTVTALPVNVHFMQANAAWRKDHCAGVTCPANQLPGAQPASCAFVPRCDRGNCSNTCDQIPEPTAMSAMPPGSPGRLDCKVDDDCAVMGLAPSMRNPCCDGPAIPSPIGRRYLEAVHMWRPLGCKDVQCPPHDTSSVELGECAMTARCVRGACADSCPP